MRRALLALLVFCLFTGSTVAPVASAPLQDGGVTGDEPPATYGDQATTQSTSSGEITYFAMDGRGYIYGQEEIVADHPGPPYVWESESLEARLTMQARPSTNTKEVCGRILDEKRDAVDSIGCTTWNTSSQRKLATLELSEWPAGTSGTRYLEFEYVEYVPADGDADTDDDEAYERVVRDRYRTEVYVISKQGDLDGDGLSNAREVELGTDFTRQDTSGNGLTDWEEVYRYGTDPLKADTTGDGFDDGTIARLGLPPTVPYVVHGVFFGGLVLLAGLLVGGVKLWRLLEEYGDPVQTQSPQRPSASPADGAAPASPADGATPAAPPATGDGAPASKEEEVYQVIHEHGGQIRQADLVEETEWSKATVSRLLSSLEEEGRLEKIRVGRGNVVRLTGMAAEPDQAEAPSESD